MKNYYLTVLLTFSFFFTLHNIRGQHTMPSLLSVSESFTPLPKGKISKAIHDTLFFEDFSDSTLGDWIVVDSTNNNYDWIWSNSAPGGQYSTNIPALNSPSSHNGFISLPSDYYNTPFNAANVVQMNAWISSKAIPIKPAPSVELSFYQSMRYCCDSSSVMEVQISNDSVNWTTFDARFGLILNQVSPNGLQRIIDVSSVLAGEDTAYIRFRQSIASHYYWMIDDVALIESYTYSLALDFSYYDHFASDSLSIHYSRVPIQSSCRVDMGGYARNFDTITHQNVRMNVKVFMDSTINGGPGQGLVYSHTTSSFTMPSGSFRKYNVSRNAYFTAGHYRAELMLLSDSIQQATLSTKEVLRFTINNDTTIARDNGQFNSIFEVGSPNRIKQDGDRIGLLMNIADSASVPVLTTSLSVFIPNDPSVIGVSLKPQIWQRTSSNSFSSAPIATSVFPTLIQSTDLGKWKTLIFFPPVQLQAYTVYLAAIEQVGGASSGIGMKVGRDQSAEDQLTVTNSQTYIYANDPHRRVWEGVRRIPGIRLSTGYHYGCGRLVGIHEEKNELDYILIQPNPTNGNFKIIGGKDFNQYQLYDLNGRIVEEGSLSSERHELNLQYLENGIYFIRLIGDRQEEVKKLIISD